MVAQVLLQDWNGTSFFPQQAPSRVITSDASGSFGCGCGAFSTQHGWFQLQWPESWSDIGITQKELVPIVVAATVWGPAWTNTCVRFRSDNMAVVEILRSRTSYDPLAMHLLRCLALYAAYYQFNFCTEHLPGTQNAAADAISRNNLPMFSL